MSRFASYYTQPDTTSLENFNEDSIEKSLSEDFISLEKVFVAMDSLQNIATEMKKSLSTGGLSTNGRAIASISVENIVAEFEMKLAQSNSQPVPGDNYRNTSISMEGVVDAIKEMWAKIVEFFKNLWNGLMKMLGFQESNVKEKAEKAIETKEKTEKAVKEVVAITPKTAHVPAPVAVTTAKKMEKVVKDQTISSEEKMKKVEATLELIKKDMMITPENVKNIDVEKAHFMSDEAKNGHLKINTYTIDNLLKFEYGIKYIHDLSRLVEYFSKRCEEMIGIYKTKKSFSEEERGRFDLETFKGIKSIIPTSSAFKTHDGVEYRPLCYMGVLDLGIKDIVCIQTGDADSKSIKDFKLSLASFQPSDMDLSNLTKSFEYIKTVDASSLYNMDITAFLSYTANVKKMIAAAESECRKCSNVVKTSINKSNQHINVLSGLINDKEINDPSTKKMHNDIVSDGRRYLKSSSILENAIINAVRAYSNCITLVTKIEKECGIVI